MTKEKLVHHLEHLRKKHGKLDKQIDLMEATRHFADDDLNHMKRQRLALRDEMESISSKIAELGKTSEDV